MSGPSRSRLWLALISSAAAGALVLAGPVAGGVEPDGAVADPPGDSVVDVVVLLYDGVEMLDFDAPATVFNLASELNGGGPFRVHLASLDGEPVTANRGLRVSPTCGFADCPEPDIFLLPGGAGVFAAMGSEATVAYASKSAAGAEEVEAICIGSFLLAKAGLLDGARLTTHRLGVDYLRQLVPTAQVVADERWVVDGKLASAAGVGPGIELALSSVARWAGEPVARATAEYLEYPWSPDPAPDPASDGEGAAAGGAAAGGAAAGGAAAGGAAAGGDDVQP